MLRVPPCTLLLVLALLLARVERAAANNSLFPPQSAAQSTIDFDGQGFLINGQRTFIASAGLEYARVPQALWADRLLRLKRAGFNCVETYVFWNYHEAQSGQFNFSGNRDLDAFLKLAKSMGLYAIVRPGPYSCAEWDSGGYPLWLRFVPNLEVRNNNAVFQQYVVRWFNQLFPIIVNNQINRGGNVLMVQLENEDYAGWGTEGLSSGNSYYQYLQSTALSAGLEVPYFFSGLHHEDTPGGNPLDRSDMQNPPSPWFSSEFYTGWITQYGSRSSSGAADRYGNPITPAQEVRNTWQVIAYGGNGYNFYLAHGGSNFDYFNNNEVGSSYDYGSPIGEAGDIRPEYHLFRQAAWFARSFQSILENSSDLTSAFVHAATNSAVAVTARQAPAGTILFLDNPSTSATRQTSVIYGNGTYPASGPLTLNPSEILPVVAGYTVIPGVTLNIAPTRILGTFQQDATTTLVIYGQPASPAELYFTVPAGTSLSDGAAAMNLSGTSLTLQTTFPSSGVSNYSFQVGTRRVRVLAVNDTLVKSTWFVDADRQNFVVVGPSYVGNAAVNNGYLQLVTENPWQNTTSYPVVAYGPGDAPMTLGALSTPGAHPDSAALSPWQTLSGIQQATPGYDTTGWLASTTGPRQMGADGDVSAYAWYRTNVNVSSAQPGIFTVANMADRMNAFVDGAAVPPANFYGTSFATLLGAGSHTLAVATVHLGRDKFLGYSGPITNVNPKGLSGTSTFLVGATPGSSAVTPVSGPTSVTGWKYRLTTSAAVGATPPAPTASGWNAYTIGTDVFSNKAGYAWFQATLPTLPSTPAQLIADFASVDDDAYVYLNGTLLTTHQGYANAFAVGLTAAWNAGGANVLSVLVQNTGGAGGLDKGVTLTGYADAVPITSWNTLSTTSSAVGATPPATTSTRWSSYAVGTDAFNQKAGYAWFQATLPALGAGSGHFVTFSSVDDNAWVYLNGTLLTAHQGWNLPFIVDLSTAWSTGKPNVLSVLVQNNVGPGGIYGVDNLGICQSSLALNSWSQQGGPGDPNATAGWQPLIGSATFGGPQFFSSTFTAPPPAGDGASAMWRVATPAAGNGSVWVNGHNLGRYPQTVSRVPGVYVPEVWLNPGTNANTLTIYDFAGTRPDSVQMLADPVAGRDVATFRSTLPLPVSLDQWRQDHFGANAGNDAVAGNLADPDGDGFNNLLEYALGSNPLVGGPSPLVTDTETVGGNTFLRLTATKNPAATGITYSVEATGDLGDPGSWSGAGVVVETNSATTLTARDGVSMNGGAVKRFLRLRVSVP